MKKLIALSGWFILLTATAFSQTRSEEFIRIDYLYVAPESEREYHDLEVKIWKELHQQLKESGKIKNWRLYKLIFPGGTKSDYNYMSITVADSLDIFSESTFNQISEELPEDEKFDSARQRTDWIQEVVFSELWQLNNQSGDSSFIHNSKYYGMDYMNVTEGRSYDYLMLEDDVARPIHEERIENEQMNGWQVFTLISPGGTEYGYNYATGNFYSTLDDIRYGFTDDAVLNAHPGTDIPELFDLIYRTRNLVRSELWELVDFSN